MSLHVPASGICRKQRHPIESPRLRIVCPKILGVTNILYTVASFRNRGWGEKNGKERKGNMHSSPNGLRTERGKTMAIPPLQPRRGA